MSLEARVRVRVYTTRVCAYCSAAKRLLSARRIPYEEIDVTSDHEKRSWLAQVTGKRTVPQIFVGDVPIGGHRELVSLDRSGRLRELVSCEGSAAASRSPAERRKLDPVL